MPLFRYMPDRRSFSRRCLRKNCDEITVTCNVILPDGKICGVKGHPDIYKHDDDHLIPVIEHAHFHTDVDRARNCFHSGGVKTIFKAPESIKEYTWRTKRDITRWALIPKEVKEQMCWGDPLPDD